MFVFFFNPYIKARGYTSAIHIIGAYGTLSAYSRHSVLHLRTRLSCRPSNNIRNSHIGRKIVRDIKWCIVIFSPQIPFEILDRAAWRYEWVLSGTMTYDMVFLMICVCVHITLHPKSAYLPPLLVKKPLAFNSAWMLCLNYTFVYYVHRHLVISAFLSNNQSFAISKCNYGLYFVKARRNSYINSFPPYTCRYSTRLRLSNHWRS